MIEMSGLMIFLLIISLISIGLLIWLAVWEWKQHTTANYVGSASAIIAVVSIIALWLVVFNNFITF
ncbi:MAG: hypothetical protein IJ756_04335 [Paludibacteraceae bacterium]|nr:hypothetical protein [Paludibacteraceae bacterium]